MLSRTFASSFVRKSWLQRLPWKRHWSSITLAETSVTVHALNNACFPYIWLRDSCQSEDCVHPSTRQKLHRTSDFSLDIRPIPGSEGIKVTDAGLEIAWTDGHRSVFARDFLETYSNAKRLHGFHLDIKKKSWDNASIQKTKLFVPYPSLTTPAGLLGGITQLLEYGLLFITGVPTQETEDDRCELRKLAEMFAEIRPTFYGLLFDVKNMKNSKNIAYTDLDLGLHMDLLYFQHPPKYQILHCLRNKVVGGTSIFVDSLAAGERLRRSHPDYFRILTATPVAFHYMNDGHHLHCEHPTIELPSLSFTHPVSTPSSSADEDRPISHVNYSPPFQAPLPLGTPLEFYPALRQFTDLLNGPESTYQYTLREGDAVVFDNRRVLHARTAFHEREDVGQEEGETNRWLKGCYLEEDAVMDRARVLKTRIRQGTSR